jgi:hypothetical protein
LDDEVEAAIRDGTFVEKYRTNNPSLAEGTAQRGAMRLWSLPYEELQGVCQVTAQTVRTIYGKPRRSD